MTPKRSPQKVVAKKIKTVPALSPQAVVAPPSETVATAHIESDDLESPDPLPSNFMSRAEEIFNEGLSEQPFPPGAMTTSAMTSNSKEKLDKVELPDGTQYARVYNEDGSIYSVLQKVGKDWIAVQFNESGIPVNRSDFRPEEKQITRDLADQF